MGVLDFFPLADCFIETGLGGGETLREALKQPYKEIHSIEIDGDLIARCSLSDPRLYIHHGSSPRMLPLLCHPHLSTVFWLDAHYSAGHYTSDHQKDLRTIDPAYGQCPLLAELEVIRAVPWEVWPWILIDDATCFLMDPYEGLWASYDRSQYPREAEIRAALPYDYQLTLVKAGSGSAYFQARHTR